MVFKPGVSDRKYQQNYMEISPSRFEIDKKQGIVDLMKELHFEPDWSNARYTSDQAYI